MFQERACPKHFRGHFRLPMHPNMHRNMATDTGEPLLSPDPKRFAWQHPRKQRSHRRLLWRSHRHYWRSHRRLPHHLHHRHLHLYRLHPHHHLTSDGVKRCRSQSYAICHALISSRHQIRQFHSIRYLSTCAGMITWATFIIIYVVQSACALFPEAFTVPFGRTV